MGTKMDTAEKRADPQPGVRLQRSYGELETVLEGSDLYREEHLAEAIIDALEAVDRARAIAEEREDATTNHGDETGYDDRERSPRG